MRNSVAVLLVLALAGPASAQLPSVDPAGQYRLIGPAARSDSRCIGSPETPLCAVETLLACFARRDTDLCRVVWAGSEGAAGFLRTMTASRYWWSYRIASAEQPAADEAVIAVAGRNCGLQMAEPDCGTTPAPPTRYRLKQVAGRWQVLDWQSQPGDPTPVR
jgi:hypothetical protein